MDIVEATATYEAWLGQFGPWHPSDLEYKHELMRSDNSFAFLRATYYRWAQCRGDFGATWVDAPKVSSIGDLHLENFGTWRDGEGRLCWGVNDFDEACLLPYTNDLVRLVTSLRIARDQGLFDLKMTTICNAVLTGYVRGLMVGGVPFVLEEHHRELRTLAMGRERDPKKFWDKLTHPKTFVPHEVPSEVHSRLQGSLPAGATDVEIRFRERVGAGSLGKSRFLAVALHHGGFVAREAKQLTPNVEHWLKSKVPANPTPSKIVAQAHRSHDPFFHFDKEWIIRRLAPRSCRIEMDQLRMGSEWELLFLSMGTETANIHLSGRKPDIANAIRDDLAQRPDDWLKKAARDAHNATIQDHET